MSKAISETIKEIIKEIDKDFWIKIQEENKFHEYFENNKKEKIAAKQNKGQI